LPLLAPTRSTILTASRRWTLIAVAAAYIAVAAVVLSQINAKTLSLAASLPWWLIAGLLGLSLINYALRAGRWVMLSRALDLRVPFGANMLYYFSGYSLTATPGKAGEAIRLWLLKSGHGIAYSRSMPLMLADRALDIWAVMLLTLVSFSGFQAYRWYGLALLVLVVAVSLPIVRPRLLEPMLLAAAGRMKRRVRLLVLLRRVLRAMDRLSSWRTYGVTLVPSVIGWLAEAAALYLILLHFGAEVSLANAVFVFSFSMIVGAISMLPGGLGSTEATMVLLLSALGVDLDVALLSTAIVRVTTFWFAVVIGLLLTPSALTASRRAANAGKSLTMKEAA
jgi:glycosyltransferase 2 family protein